MQWLSISSAWYSLSLLIIIAMYLFKRTYPPRYMSSHMLWRRVLEEREANKPWQKLKNNILLWLQLLVALCIVLALMEPNILSEKESCEQVVIVIDRSASMTSSVPEHSDSTLLENAKEEASKWIKENTGKAKITAIINGETPQIIASVDHRGTSEVLRAIAEVEPFYGVSDDSTTLSLARVIAEQSQHSTIRIYADQQFYNRTQATDSDTAARSNEQYVLSDGMTMVGIRNFTISERREGQGNIAYATIYHPEHWKDQIKATFIAFNEQHEVIGTADIVDVKKHLNYSVLTSGQLPTASYYKLELEQAEGDYNRLDNIAFQFGSHLGQVEALLISDGNLFLEKALQLVDVRWTKVSAKHDAPQLTDLSRFQFIVVDGGYRKLQQDEQWTQLLKQKPLWIIDHPDEALSLIPVTDRIKVIEHPITNYLNFDDVYISKFEELTPEELNIGQAIVLYDSVPAVIAGNESGYPNIRFTFSLSDSDLPLRAQFPVLVMQSIQYLTSGMSYHLGSVLVDSYVNTGYSLETTGLEWKLVDFISNREVNVGHKNNEQAKKFVAPDAPLFAPSLPGLYELIESDINGGIVKKRIANVMYDQNELQLDQFQWEGINQKQSDVISPEIRAEKEKVSLLGWIMTAILLIILLEWEVYRRGL